MYQQNQQNQLNFQYTELPRDEQDCRFIKSFEVGESTEILQFFEEYGFVVIRNVLTPDECSQTIMEMFDHVKKSCPSFDPNDKSTWSEWKSESFGMSGKEPLFTPQILRNRQNEKVYQSFSTMLGTGKILSNHDRWAIYRPTMVCGTKFKTPDNIHLDLNPWRFEQNDETIWKFVDSLCYQDVRDFVVENTHVTKSTRGRQVQGILNLHDNEEYDGGLVLIPGFHHYFSQWVDLLGPMIDPDCRYKFPSNHPFQKFAQRITCRQGSLVIWDHRCIHGTRGNMSETPRLVQFIRMFSVENMSKKRQISRKRFIERELNKINFNPTKIGKIVFGLN